VVQISLFLPESPVVAVQWSDSQEGGAAKEGAWRVFDGMEESGEDGISISRGISGRFLGDDTGIVSVAE
jgi:hypothetical protein